MTRPPQSLEGANDNPRHAGFNLIGHVSGNLGLGVSARHIGQLLLDNGEPFAVLDLDPGHGRGGFDDSLTRFAVSSPDALPYAINLAILPAPAAPLFFLYAPPVIGCEQRLAPGADYWFSKDRLNAAFVWWELAALSPTWIRALELFDVVIGASPFIRSVLETHLSNVLAIPAVHPFSPPANVERGRARYGLPENVVLFVTSFEPHSDPARKNPLAVIDAFQQAFPSSDSASLVIKVNNAEDANKTYPVLDVLRQRCAADARLRLFERNVSYSDVLGLYGSCDAFVSLHRAEGLGLGLMEAMWLGMPVIATAWSGNMAFMDHSNSCLVRYRLVPVDAGSRVYGRRAIGTDATWAEPDIADAAAWMRKLVDDPAFRRSLGARASEAIARHAARAREASFIAELNAIAHNTAFLPQRTEHERRERLAGLKRAVASSVPMHRRLARRVRRSRFTETFSDLADRYVLWRFNR